MRRALAQAIARRRSVDVRAQLGVGTDVYRLVHGEADGMPGVIVDRYADVARVELYDATLERELPDLARALGDEGEGTRGVVALVRAKRAQDSRLFVVTGDVPRAHVVHEDGARYLVRVAEADAVGTGIFVDHREGRRLVRAHARGGRVMNLFAHAGGFGVAAVAGGASRIDHVDAARKCARAHRFLVDDAFRVLARAARRGPELDVLVCDPPTTGLDPRGKRFKTRAKLPELAETGARALASGGLYLLSTNDRAVSPAEVADALREGARAAGRAVASVREIPLGPDLPRGRDDRLRPMRGAALVLA
jgi:23S rRNA (cytosine1962-C5)-methyltransferase